MDQDELRRAHRQLAVKTFELRSLLDISRELTAGAAQQAVLELVVTAAMGHFVVARCALYLASPRGLELAHARGPRRETESDTPVALDDGTASLEGPTSVAELADGALRRRLEQARLVLAVPLRSNEGVLGLLAIGRASCRERV